MRRAKACRLRPAAPRDLALLRRLCAAAPQSAAPKGPHPRGEAGNAGGFSTVCPADVENPYGRYFTQPRSFDQLTGRALF